MTTTKEFNTYLKSLNLPSDVNFAFQKLGELVSSGKDLLRDDSLNKNILRALDVIDSAAATGSLSSKAVGKLLFMLVSIGIAAHEYTLMLFLEDYPERLDEWLNQHVQRVDNKYSQETYRCTHEDYKQNLKETVNAY